MLETVDPALKVLGYFQTVPTGPNPRMHPPCGLANESVHPNQPVTNFWSLATAPSDTKKWGSGRCTEFDPSSDVKTKLRGLWRAAACRMPWPTPEHSLAERRVIFTFA